MSGYLEKGLEESVIGEKGVLLNIIILLYVPNL